MATAVIERPHVLHSVKEYNGALEALDQLLDRNPKKGTREFELLELLTLLVEDYETRNIPEPPTPTPQAMVKFMLEQKGMTRADLEEPLGGKSRVSEFLAGKRPLSTSQIRALRALLGIPADLLLEEKEEEGEGVRYDPSMKWKPVKFATARGVLANTGRTPKALAAKRNPAAKKK
jgi:HTH-type transcriptional regulator/antitoxin HigA